jgi:hypothetical protein
MMPFAMYYSRFTMLLAFTINYLLSIHRKQKKENVLKIVNCKLLIASKGGLA